MYQLLLFQITIIQSEAKKQTLTKENNVKYDVQDR